MTMPLILDHIAACARGEQQLIAAVVSTFAACGIKVRESMPRGRYGAALREEILHVLDFHRSAHETDEMLEVLTVVARRWSELSRGRSTP